jgi:hypothetical protein
MGSYGIFRLPLCLAGVDDAHHRLTSVVDVDMPNLYRLFAAPPEAVEGSDQIKLQPEELVGGGAVSTDVFVGHAVLALPQKAKSGEPRRNDFHCD